MMMFSPLHPRLPEDTERAAQEIREQEIGEGIYDHSGLSEQEISRLKNTTPDLRGLSEQEISQLNKSTPQSVFYIVAWIVAWIFIILLVIVGLVLLSVFR
jgi:hypothetical protein